MIKTILAIIGALFVIGLAYQYFVANQTTCYSAGTIFGISGQIMLNADGTCSVSISNSQGLVMQAPCKYKINGNSIEISEYNTATNRYDFVKQGQYEKNMIVMSNVPYIKGDCNK